MRDAVSTKLLVVSPNEEERNKVYAILSEHLDDKASIIKSNPEFTEILVKGVNKGVGLRGLCEKLGVPLEQVIAFGDAGFVAFCFSLIGVLRFRASIRHDARERH